MIKKISIMATPLSIARSMKDDIVGNRITLSRLYPQNNHKVLYENAKTESIWAYVSFGPFGNEDSFQVYMEALAYSDWLVFVIKVNETKEEVGVVCLMNIHEANKCIEIGNLWITPKYQRSFVNTETNYLLLTFCFEKLQYRRVEWKCDNLNEKSKKAALGLGFTYEGLFRQHMLIKGRNRDTAWFSIIDVEWPIKKKSNYN